MKKSISLNPELESFNWESLIKTSWERKPILFKAPFQESPYKKEWFLGILKRRRQSVSKDTPSRINFFLEDGSSFPGGAHSGRMKTLHENWFPNAEEGDLEEYLQRLESIPSFSRYGIHINGPHDYDQNVWKITREVLRNLYEHIPMPSADINTDVFIGNYFQTPFGAHLDKLHNLMFMVAGKRTMRLWPYEVGMSHFGHPSNLVRDYEAALKDSIVFELESGDMLYWPDNYWHVGENKEPSSVSMNIDYMTDPVLSWESRALRKIIKQQTEALAFNTFRTGEGASFPTSLKENNWKVQATSETNAAYLREKLLLINEL